MCKWGTSTPLNVFIPAQLSRTGAERWDVKDVDSCIAPLVEALNSAGMTTIGSCCGHGKRPGNVVLADGREIVIMPDHRTGRLADRLYEAIGFEPINPWCLSTRLRAWPRRFLLRVLARLLTQGERWVI